jgi:histidyl-tRNA synthetase
MHSLFINNTGNSGIMTIKRMIQPLKGTRDFYPEIMAIRTWLYNAMRQVSESFGYQEYEAPFLESIDLYAAKSGDELVNQQSAFPDRRRPYCDLSSLPA